MNKTNKKIKKINCKECKRPMTKYGHVAEYGTTTFDVCHFCGDVYGTTTSAEIKSLLQKDEKMFYYMLKCEFLTSI